MPSGRHSINFPLPLSPVSFFIFLRLVALLSVQGVCFSPISWLIPSIITAPHFPNKKFPCSCCVYLFVSQYCSLLDPPPQPSTIFMILSVPTTRVIFFSFRTLPKVRKKTYFSLAYFRRVWVQFIHESLGTFCGYVWVIMGFHIQLKYQSAVFFWSPCVVMSLFPL